MIKDFDEIYKKIEAEVKNRFNIKTDLPEPPEYDPVMIDIVFMHVMFDDFRNELNELFELARQRNDEIANIWKKREKEALDNVNKQFEILISKNTESLNSVFLNAMRKSIAEGNSGLGKKISAAMNAYSKHTNRLSFSSILLIILLGVNLLFEFLKIFNFL